MKRKQLIVLSRVVSIVILTFVGYMFNFVSFEHKGRQANFDPVENLSGIQNITGKFYSSPGSIDQILAIFAESKTSVSIEIYEFTEKRFKEAFRQLLEKNVNIRLIMENRKYQQFKNTFKDIQNYFSGYDNFQIQSDNRMKTTYVHSKFALIDSGFLIQTANLTHSSFFSNREYFFYSQHTGVYQSLARIFEKDWLGENIENADIHPNLLVCPINCRAVLEHLIGSAKSSILIENQYITDDNLIKLLEEKIKCLGSGNIEIKLPETETNKSIQKKWGKSIVTLIKKPYIHAKMMLIDDQILYLGSINFSANSMDNNREIGILIKDKVIIKQFRDIFYKK